MARVVIVSKTWWGSSGFCVGGLDLDTNKNLRLLGIHGAKQPKTTPFNIGQIWNIDYFQNEKVDPPHNEDANVLNSEYIGQQSNLQDFLKKRVHLWNGGINRLFGGLLVSQNMSCFISRGNGIPNVSTGFWIPDKPLIIYHSNDKIYYMYNYDHPNISPHCYKIPYVGVADPIACIPEDTLIRVSLARWWQRPGTDEERCYLQLSGWHM